MPVWSRDLSAACLNVLLARILGRLKVPEIVLSMPKIPIKTVKRQRKKFARGLAYLHDMRQDRANRAPPFAKEVSWMAVTSLPIVVHPARNSFDLWRPQLHKRSSEIVFYYFTIHREVKSSVRSTVFISPTTPMVFQEGWPCQMEIAQIGIDAHYR